MCCITTGVGSGGAQGAAAPLNAGRRGLHHPTNLRQWVSETRCEAHRVFAPAPRRTATVVQGKLALPGLLAHAQIARHVEAWLVWYNYMHCCAEGLALQCPSSSDELINYIIIITMFVPFTLFHVDRHLKRLDNHSQYSVEQIGSDCTRIDLRASVFLKFSAGACPRTPLASLGFARTFALHTKH